MAKGSGRRSAADRVAATATAAIKPTRTLSPEERKVWRSVTDAWPRDHFVSSDALLLQAYCVASVTFDRLAAAEPADLDSLSKAARMMAMLSTKLRLTPQSRLHRHKAGAAAHVGRQNAPARKRLLGGMEWPDTDSPPH